MADIFSTDDIRKLFQNKFIFMLGDSNMRANYKDLVQLINKNALLSLTDIRRRGEAEFLGDQRIVHSGMIKGRGYAEGRDYIQNGVHVQYNFITRCYNEEIEQFLHNIKNGAMKTPDVFIMNSCLWDISRWGPHGVDAYKENMRKLMLLLKNCLPAKTLFIWTTTLPVSSLIRGGLLIKQIDFLQDMLRFEVMEANIFCRQLIVSHGYDVLDTHYHLRMQVHRRFKDGLHYNPLPVRLITNLLLTHVSLSWGIPLPGRSHGIALERVIKYGVPQRSSKTDNVILPTLPDCINTESNQSTNKTDSVPQKMFANSNPKKRKSKNKNVTWKPALSQNGQNLKSLAGEGDSWKNGGWLPPRNKSSRNNPPCRNVPPRQQHHQQQGQYQNYWQDLNCEDNSVQQIPQNANIKEAYQRNLYADFSRLGPVRKNPKFSKNRTRPY